MKKSLHDSPGGRMASKQNLIQTDHAENIYNFEMCEKKIIIVSIKRHIFLLRLTHCFPPTARDREREGEREKFRQRDRD